MSDYLGRPRVILAALTVTAGACAVFLAAHCVGLLFAARALQGVAVGTATGALGAALIDLQPEGSGLAPLITTAAIFIISFLGLSIPALIAGVATAHVGLHRTALAYCAAIAALVAAAAGP